MNFWILSFLSFFWLASIVIGWKFKNTDHNVSDFLIGKRKLSFFIFVFAITSIFITNINFFSQPSLNLNVGFIGSYLAFSVMMIGLVSIFFSKETMDIRKKIWLYYTFRNVL